MLERSQLKKNRILLLLFSKKLYVPEKFLCRNLVKDCFQFTTQNEEKQENKNWQKIKKHRPQKNEASLEI